MRKNTHARRHYPRRLLSLTFQRYSFSLYLQMNMLYKKFVHQQANNCILVIELFTYSILVFWFFMVSAQYWQKQERQITFLH